MTDMMMIAGWVFVIIGMNLAALCQRCHLGYDLADHVRNRKYGRRVGQLPLLAALLAFVAAACTPTHAPYHPTRPLGFDHPIDSTAAPWSPGGTPVQFIHCGMYAANESETWFGFAGDATLPFLFGRLAAWPERDPLHPALRELNDQWERRAKARGEPYPRGQWVGSRAHTLRMDAMTGTSVTRPVTVKIRRAE